MRAAFALLPLLLAAPALAQGPASTPSDPTCENVRVAPPAELAGWSQQVPMSAGVKPGDGATVTLGKAALVSLHPTRHLALAPVATDKAVDGNGGTLALAITEAGTYRIALGGKAWVDLVQQGKAIASVAHTHGPKCSGIRKIVDFKLTPGNYAIQLSGSADEAVAVMVVKIA